ncbi:MAG: 16S rRNA (guanine(966)-N(2))-methyltransferase RsmD [Pyrinomonadaceae bacterium]|nr:16S rRNA (guanine(966)-N(2))-methyltransferase RsmD [Pyrinomonadaceae bacterium]
MRIIAGQYRGRVLKSPPSLQIRPTSDRLRETLFNVLAPRIEGVRFLDLCSGSGAVGIEALSRGASHVTFVDKSRKMCGLIEANLDLCGVPEDETEVVLAEAAEFLRRAIARNGGEARWEIAFFDPPYKIDYVPVLAAFGSGSILDAEDGLLVVEHHHKNEMKDEIGAIRRWRVLKQGDSCLSFYEQR